MQKHWTWLYTFACMVCLSISSCTSDKVADATLEPQRFNERLQSQQGVLLDVRTPEEFDEAHLPDAQNIDYKADSFKAFLAQLDKNKTYFMYCKAGVRSGKAVDVMQEMGFANVYHMEGGLDAWKEAGLPLNK